MTSTWWAAMWRRHALGVGVVVALWMVMFARLLLWPQGEVLSHSSGDIALAYYDWAQFTLAQRALHNWLPLYNPHVLSGTPFLGSTATSALYAPARAAQELFGAGRGINVDVALHTLLFMLGVYALWVEARRSTGACVLAAVALGFGMPFGARIVAGHVTIIDCFAWFPYGVLCARRLCAAEASVLTLGLTLVGITAAQGLSGHPQTTALCCVVYLGVVGFGVRHAPTLRARAIVAVAAIAWAACIAAVAVGAGAAALSESVREHAGTDAAVHFATSFSFTPENLLTLLSPTALGAPGQAVAYWGQWLWWENVAFVGTGTLALAAFGVGHAMHARQRPLLALCAVTALAVATSMATTTPLLTWLVKAVPPLSMVRAPNRLWMVAVFVIVWCATCALDALFCDDVTADARRRGFGIASAACAALLAVASVLCAVGSGADAVWWLVHHAEASGATLRAPINDASVFLPQACTNLAAGLRQSAAVCAALALATLVRAPTLWSKRIVITVCVLDVAAHALVVQQQFVPTRAVPRGFDELPRDGALTEQRYCATNFGNSAMRAGLFNAYGYDPANSARMQRFISIAMPRRCADATGPLLSLARVQHVLSAEGMVTRDDALPHAFVAPHVTVVNDADGAALAIALATFAPARDVVVEHDVALADGGADDNAPVAVTRVDSDTLTLDVTLHNSAVVVVTDAYSRDLVATDDGAREVPILAADLAFVALPLDAGSHHVRLRYRPALVVLGARVSTVAAVSYAVSCAVVAVVRLRRRRSRLH